MSKSKSRQERPASEMSPRELDEMAAEFDREFVADTFGPVSPEMQARLDRAKAKRGRPRTGEGSKVISVTVDKTLLRQINALARRMRTPRAQLVARGLRAVIAAEAGSTRAVSRKSKESVKKKAATD
jgi:hypothetical protein